MSHTSPVNFLQVFEDEQTEVVRRRRAAGLARLGIPGSPDPASPPDSARANRPDGSGRSAHDPSRPDDGNGRSAGAAPSPQRGCHNEGAVATVGLALSGGGMRSASIGLGLLQSLYRRGVLRHVDYFSTVSGGGYAGALLSSSILAEQNREKQINWGPRDAFDPANHHEKRLDFDADVNGPQPDVVRTIARKGESLRRPLLFASRWFWGFLVIGTFVVSGLLAATSFAAWLFRLLDGREAIIYLQQLGFRSDLSRAFMPSFVLLIAWLVSQIVFAWLRRTKSRVPDIPAVVFILFVISVVLAVAALFATGDISLVALQEVFGWTSQATEFLDETIRWLGRGMAALFAISVLPLLTPATLLRSGTRPKKPWHRWAFNFASHGVVFGIPLMLFYLLSKENISDHNELRPDRFTFSEVQVDSPSLSRFWGAVAADQPAEPAADEDGVMRLGGGPGHRVWSVARDAGEPDDLGNGSEEKDSAALLLNLQGHVNHEDRQIWFFQRWTRFVFQQLGISQEFDDNLANRRRFWHIRRELNNAINDECLSDPGFYLVFAESSSAADSGAIPAGESEPGAIPTGDGGGDGGQIKLAERYEALKVPQWYFDTYEVTEFEQVWNRAKVHAESQRQSAGAGVDSGKDPPADATADEDSGPADIESAESSPTGNEQMAGDRASRTWLLTEVENLRDQVALMESKLPTVPEFYEEQFHEELQKLSRERDEHERRLTAIRETNWAMIDAYFNAQGVKIRPPDTVFAVIVNPEDQKTRLRICLVSLLVFVLVGLVIPVNPTTLHTFYRDQIATVWIIEDSKVSGRRIPLKQLELCRAGGPYHLINGALNLFGGRTDPEQDGTARFSFTQLYCGAARVGYRPTGLYAGGNLTLANVTAISGGAVTPGRIDNILVRTLLYLLNFRLGQWLPNPANPPSDVSWPSMLRLLVSHVMRRTEERNYCFVSDGGHDENTGIGALLERRCRVIVACDASEDAQYEFLDFQRMHQDAVNKHGVRIVNLETHVIPDDPDRLDFDDLIPPARQKRRQPGEQKPGDGDASERPDRSDKHARSHYVIARIIYPDDDLSRSAGMGACQTQRTGYLIYIKPTLTGSEPSIVKHFSVTNPEFPHDTTFDQFFKEDRFWVYRALGDRMGEVVYNENFRDVARSSDDDSPWLSVWTPGAPPAEPTPEPTPVDVRQRVRQLLEAAALLATRMEHARVTGNPDEERELRSSDNELLIELTALGPDTVDAAEEVLHAIAADHPWELALRALVRDEQSGWGDQALRACALYATEPSLCLRFTEPAARERIALAASDMLTGLVIDKPLDGFSKRRLCDALARNELPERLRVNLVDVLFRISEHHPRYRAEMESVLEQAGAMEGADRELKKRVKRALGWLRR